MQPIKLENLRELVDAGAVKSAQIVGQKGGYTVVAMIGAQQRPLGAKRGGVRLFTAADSAIKALRELGLMQFSVDVTHYEAGRLRAVRADLLARHNKAREALAHDRWFREQVESTQGKIERGQGRWIEHDAFWNDLEVYAREQMASRDARRG